MTPLTPNPSPSPARIASLYPPPPPPPDLQKFTTAKLALDQLDAAKGKSKSISYHMLYCESRELGHVKPFCLCLLPHEFFHTSISSFRA